MFSWTRNSIRGTYKLIDLFFSKAARNIISKPKDMFSGSGKFNNVGYKFI